MDPEDSSIPQNPHYLDLHPLLRNTLGHLRPQPKKKDPAVERCKAQLFMNTRVKKDSVLVLELGIVWG